MSIMDKSIASRIALLLGLFCLVLCAFLISLLQLLKMLSEEADETVNVALPNMAIASYISKESEWAKGILHDSILCRDRFVHLGVVQEIEARRFPENVLESLEALAVDPGVKEKIKNNLNELNGILAGTNQAVAQRIDNLRNTERLVKRIRTLNADLPQLERELYASGMKPGDPGFNVWKTAYSDVLTAMLLLSMHHDRPYSLRLKSEIRTDVKRLLRSAEASPFSGRLKNSPAMRPQWPSRKTAFLLCMRNTRRWKAHWMPSRSPINIPQTASSSRPTPFPSSHGRAFRHPKRRSRSATLSSWPLWG